jgi:hypothetical protein
MSSSTHQPVTIAAPPATKLNRDNFLSWQTQILPSLRGGRVVGILDGTEKAPPETLEAEDADKKTITIPNPEYDTWVTKDQAVVSFLINSLGDDLLSHVYGLVHADRVWKAILELFSTQSKSRVSSLRGALTNTKSLI